MAKKTKKIKGKAAASAAAEPGVATSSAAAPVAASTSSSTPASIKKKIKKAKAKNKSKIPETEIVAAKEPKPATAECAAPAPAPPAPSQPPPAMEETNCGFIFMCNSRTKPECYHHGVFGLPMGKAELLKRINPGTKLFLYDFNLRMLYGVYSAASPCGMNLVPGAFGGAFPAQVKFKIDEDCIPVTESSFKQAILENYDAKNRFYQVLSSKQVHKLLSLFRPVSSAPQTVPAQYTEHRLPPAAHLPPPADPNRYLPPPRMPPPEDPCRPGGHLAPPHMPPPGQVLASHLPPPGQVLASHLPPPEDPYRTAGQVVHSHIPQPEDPYGSTGHVVASHLHAAEDPYRSIGSVVASYLLPPDDPYRSGRYMVHPQLPPEDPYRHAYPAQVPIDSRYLSQLAPPPAHDPHVPQLFRAPPPADPYYPTSSNGPYGQVEASRAYYPGNPAMSDRVAYRTAPVTALTNEPSTHQTYHLQPYRDANRAHTESIQRQAMGTAPVSSLYAFAGVTPTYHR